MFVDLGDFPAGVFEAVLGFLEEGVDFFATLFEFGAVGDEGFDLFVDLAAAVVEAVALAGEVGVTRAEGGHFVMELGGAADDVDQA